MRIYFTRFAATLCFLVPMLHALNVSGQCTLAVSGTVIDETCEGFFDGAIDLVVSGETGIASFNWSNSATTEDINTITSGTYTVTVSDQGGCTVIDTFDVFVAHAITVSLGNDTTLCAITNYVLSPNAAGATFYFWQDNSQNSTYLANAPGSYNVFVQNSYGCYASDTIQLSQYPVLQASIASIQPGCGAALGSLDLTPSGGTMPFDFLWSTGSTNEDLTALSPNTYFVTMTDGNDCQVITNGIILTPSHLSAFSTDATIVCDTDSLRFYSHTYGFLVDGVNDYLEVPDTALIRPANEFTLEAWVFPSSVSGAAQVIVEKRILSNDGISLTFDPVSRKVAARVQNGPFFAMLTSNASLNLGVWNHLALVVDSVATHLYVDGTQDTSISYTQGASQVIGTPWRIGGGPSRVSFNGMIDEIRLWQIPLTASEVLEFGERTMPVGLNDLMMYFNFSQLPGTSLVDDHSPSGIQGHFVNADTNAVWVITNPLDLSYLWQFGDGTFNNSHSPIHNYQDNVWLIANVTLRVSNSQGCQTTDTLVLPVHTPASPMITQSVPGPFCLGDSTFLSVSPNYASYLWSTGSTNDSILTVATGNYSVSADDGSGCVHVDTVILRFYPNTVPFPVITPGDTSVFCEGDSLILDVGSGYTLYQWSNGGSGQSIVVTDSGSFMVTVSNGFGCTRVSDTATAIMLPAPIAYISQSNDTLYATPGTSYQWFLGANAIPGAINNYYVPTVSGNYQVHVGSPGHCDALSATFSYLVGMAEHDFGGEWILFPNPTTSTARLQVFLHRPCPLTVQILDLQGKELWQQEIRANEGENWIELPTANLASGAYLLQVLGRNDRFVRMISKM